MKAAPPAGANPRHPDHDLFRVNSCCSVSLSTPGPFMSLGLWEMKGWLGKGAEGRDFPPWASGPWTDLTGALCFSLSNLCTCCFCLSVYEHIRVCARAHARVHTHTHPHAFFHLLCYTCSSQRTTYKKELVQAGQW